MRLSKEINWSDMYEKSPKEVYRHLKDYVCLEHIPNPIDYLVETYFKGDYDMAEVVYNGYVDYYLEELTKNISPEDYVIWDTVKNEVFGLFLDTVYHYTTIVEMVNDGFTLPKNSQLACVAGLPLKWRIKISNAIEKTK